MPAKPASREAVKLEVWKDIPGKEGIYQVSTFGNVRSLDRYVRSKGDSLQFRPGKVLKPVIKKGTGYAVVTLGNNKQSLVHELVLVTFIGPKPTSKHEARHFPDRTRSNNHVSNLSWGTPQENQLDRNIHGTDNRGEKQPNHKLTKKDVLYIRKMRKKGMSGNKLARILKVDRGHIYNVDKRKSWSHV